MFSGGDGALRSTKTVYIDIPDGVHEILLGVLFSSAGLKSLDSFKLYSLNIEEVTTLSDVADAGYVLNLDGEEEKFKYCHHVLSREGFKVERMPAINGSTDPFVSNFKKYLEEPLSQEDLLLGRKAIQSPGAWGYLLSMKKVFMEAIKNKYEKIAVFDDDLILAHDFTLKFSRFMGEVPDNWDVLMLGASQWEWDGIILDDEKNWYYPNASTNGSFAIIYHSRVFEKLIEGIDKMTSPFDSKPLKTVTCDSEKVTSFVAWPNIVIADVEKEGIRARRDQKDYADRFKWEMDDFPDNYKRWRSSPVLLHESKLDNWPTGNRKHLVMAVTTINRWDYLEKFISSWYRTRNNSYNWTLIIADDGSTDSTIRRMMSYDLPNTQVIIIQNSGGGIAIQTNSMFNYCLQMENEPDLIFSVDDDIYFKQKGWDTAYLNAVMSTGYDHLVHFNPDWKPSIHDQVQLLSSIKLRSMTDGISCMGCFYTLTPKLLKTIGGFDQDAFPIRGHSHIDFTMRACRAGFNDLNTLFDIYDACDFIGIHPKEGYVQTIGRYSYSEQLLLADPKEKDRRWELVNNDGRISVPLPDYKMLGPSECHFHAKFVE